jgi:hypothetical protein
VSGKNSGGNFKAPPRAARLTRKQSKTLFARYEAGLFAFEKLASRKNLSPDMKSDLQFIYYDGLRAKLHLIEAFAYLVDQEAEAAVRETTVINHELNKFGTVALIQAIDKYDFESKILLTPYLRRSVRAAIEFLCCLRENRNQDVLGFD